MPCEVGEDEEVSIKEVADAIVNAVGFKGDYTVTGFSIPNLAEADQGLVVRYNSCRWTIQEAGFEQETVAPHRGFQIHSIRRRCGGWTHFASGG